MGKGKAQPLNSLILTEHGFVQMKDIKLGMNVFGEDGELHKVIETYPQGKKEVFKITFSDRSTTRCCGEHLWTYQTPYDKMFNRYQTKSLFEIMQMPLYQITNRGDKNWQFFIPITQPIKFAKRLLPLDPYVLGILLGDGSLRGQNGSIMLTNSERDIVEKVARILGDEFLVKIAENRLYNYRITDNNPLRMFNQKGQNSNRLKQILNNLNLLGVKSPDKFVPVDYLYSDIDDRLNLLRGLIDTDGEVHNNTIAYSTTSGQLVKDIQFLVQSLGGTASISNRQTYFTYTGVKKAGLPSYRIYIKMPNDILAFTSIKHSSNYKVGHTSPKRTIQQIESDGIEECQCILVDNPTHLYLTNDFIVTHNTSAAINFINQSDASSKFLFITPYLKEVDRIIESCQEKEFKQPATFGSKLNGIKYLFEKGENIASTHQLFMNFDDEIIEMIYDQHYILIMDEVASVVDKYFMTPYDLDNILNTYARVNKDGILEWYSTSYTGDFNPRKKLCDLNSLAVYEKNMLWLFPIKTFSAFKDIYILTYLFQAQMQKYYYDYFGVKYDYCHVAGNSIDTYRFTPDLASYSYPDYKTLINIIENDRLNEIGEMPTALSKHWYERNKDKPKIKQLKNNTINFFKNYSKTKTQSNLWTTFKDYKQLVSGKGYGRGFVSCNMRATNEFKEKTSVAYLINKYFDPNIKNFFAQHGVEVDEDAYALSELLQFLFRSAIREGNPIDLYIPSSRMRNLLKQWLNNISNTDTEGN